MVKSILNTFAKTILFFQAIISQCFARVGALYAGLP